MTVGAVDDSVYEGPHAAPITHSASSADLDYDGITVTSVAVSITDNDGPGVSVTETGGSTLAVEGALGDSYAIALTSQPISDVTLTLSTGNGIGATPACLTFTPLSWSDPQVIAVSAIDDHIAEGPHAATIAHAAASADPVYNGAFVRGVTVQITDDDAAGVSVDEGDGVRATEGAGSDTYSLVLNSQPLADVTVRLSCDSQVAASPVTLTFNPANWNMPQSVTVSAVDDRVAEGSHAGNVLQAAASADQAYEGMAVPSVHVDIGDNDIAGVSVVEAGGSTTVAEGSDNDTYNVVLTSQPTAPVSICLNHDEKVNTGATLLTFTDQNWDHPQTVQASAFDDNIAEGEHASSISHQAASSDARYNGIGIAGIIVTIMDNEVAGISLEGLGGMIAEGGAPAGYTVRLTSQPRAPVAIDVLPDAQLSASPSTLHFTAGNWNQPQPISYVAVDDAIAEGPHQGFIRHEASSVDTAYDGIPLSPAVVDVTDNDTARVNLAETLGSTKACEGGAQDIYAVTLNSEPTAPVQINASCDSQVTANPAALLFTAANWNMPQTVTVSAVDDWVAEGAHLGVITHSVTSADPFYQGLPVVGLTVQVSDNDTAGVIVSEHGHSADVSEGGASDTYTLCLAGQPMAEVTVSPIASPEVMVDKTSIVFTPADWNTAQTVTVTAVDDRLAEGAHSGLVSHTVASTDVLYSGIPVTGVVCHVADNDSAGVTLNQSVGSTDVSEAGATDSYTLALNSQPAANVTVHIVCDAQETASLPEVTFTPADWDRARTVVVSAIDDSAAEGAHTGAIAHQVQSADPGYDHIDVAPLAVHISDNDAPGVILTESDSRTQVTEGGPSDSYALALQTRP